MYVARFTKTPEQDIERGWSGYFAPFYADVTKALDFFGFLPDDELTEDELIEIAEEKDLVRDPHTGAWRPFHHAGLSCWELNADTEIEAITEAAGRDLVWGGFGDRTIGTVRLVGKVKDDLYVFECEDVGGES